jgi:hypothetical protein
MNDTDARCWHPWLRINRVMRVMLHTRWSAEAWAEVRVEFRKALALRSQIRRASRCRRTQTQPGATSRRA